MAVKFGVCEVTCFYVFEDFITAVFALCALQKPIRFAIIFQPTVSSNLGIEPLDTYYHRRLLRWVGHVSRMPLTRAPRKLLTGWVEHPRPIGCPQMTWGRTLKKVLKSVKLPTDFVQWRIAAADRDQWRVICGSKSRTQKEISNLSRSAIWDKLRYGAAQPP